MHYRRYYCTPKPDFKGTGFYGYVSGIEDSKMVYAATLDEFEEEFHRYVDEYLRVEEEHRRKGKARSIVWISVFLLLFGGGIITCPDRSDHSDALAELFVRTSHMQGDSELVDLFYMLFGTDSIKQILESQLSVRDYVLFSVGRMYAGSEYVVVSYGFLGHVFTVSEKEFESKVLNEVVL